MRSIAVRTVVGLLVLSATAFAEEEGALDEAQENIEETTDEVAKEAGVKSEVLEGSQYGSAGCGLGSMIFEPSESFMQVFAATTNGLSGTQTFGITSGTSNCDTGGGTARDVETFIAANRATLAVEAARGRGETIASLSSLAACGDAGALARSLQSNFKTIFPSSTVSDQEVGHNMVTLMRSDRALGCSSLT
ncbi:MAG TPA: DUF3015 family protein [Polyangiaceae bacterium]|nr:DUF3015 family protein [Polyangiaceae bacterium]